MTRPRVLPTLAAALPALALLLLPADADAQRNRTLSSRFTAPGRVAGFRLVSSGPLPGGARLRYALGEDLAVDAYVLPLPPDAGCMRACDSAAVDAEADSVLGALPADSPRVEVERDDTVRLAYPGGVAHGRHLRLRAGSAGRPQRAHYLLYGVGTYLVRVRAAFPPAERRDSLTAHFARELVRALASPAEGGRACAAGPADPENVRLTVDSRAGIDELRERAAPTLRALGFTLSPGAAGADSLLTEPVEGWPSGIDYGAWARERSPGFVVGVRLEDRGSRTRILVTAQALCAAAAAGGEDPRAMELSLELRTASEVLRRLDPTER